ncbi:FecCD family ABC transporter permease [Egibacter rhizosphaerae]|uniref:FecCD family ABC transporter permease n=1 Tax=Egibacter rhizosphaerae TaxID=1670831 RepID=UPI00197B05CC|nr:iron ABC transporter permease [Egibacter rhizosphaerae]
MGLLVLAVGLAVAVLASLRFGSVALSTEAALGALLDFDGSSEHLIVRRMRLPRTMIGLGAGASLAVAGAIMQAATRNPLAGPGILGVNAGAAVAVVTTVHVAGAVTPRSSVWVALAGALTAALLVYVIGAAGRSGATPIKLALAGLVTTALLESWTSAALVLDRRTLDQVRFWLAGSLAGGEPELLWQVAPLMLAGIVLALLLARQLNALALGDDVARALGQRTGSVRVACLGVVVLLAGSAVAVAGPIAFVGLAVPHIARVLTGPDYRWVQAYAVVLGPTLLLAADVLGRVVARPSELQVGIVTALLGAPFLVALARRRSLPSV